MKLGPGIAAVVVGGASGMGEATVRALRARDVQVAVLDFNREKGTAVAAETGAAYFQADVTDEASVVAAFEAADGGEPGQVGAQQAHPGG